MHIIILCGGSGTRMQDYSFPKPLNMIYGKYAIAYTIENIPDIFDTLHIIVAPHLLKYNFKEIVVNLFPKKKFIFYDLPYFTRGALESAYIGTRLFPNTDESLIFLDNDVIYKFPDTLFALKDTNFLGYAEDTTGTESYSFLRVDKDGYVVDYKEKIRISNTYCCGVYGFKNISYFREIAYDILNSDIHNEVYMSSAYTYMLGKNIKINSVKFDKALHIGSLTEVQNNINDISKNKLRICFDLDNTLVTYPSIPKDYSTIKPIYNMINLAKKLKSEGHTIIIYTARRMTTHSHNIGAVIKDIGYQTFKTLDEFNIPYDELIFGKPIADMYIDDKAINPYRHDMKSLGLIDYGECVKPVNMIPTNRYNTIEIINGNLIRKFGPTKYLSGEIYFYNNIPKDSLISNYFPIFFGSKKLSDTHSEIYIENINGIPLYTLFKNELLTEYHIDKLFEILNTLHHTGSSIILNKEDICANYIDKLKERFKIKEDYPFINADIIQEKCINLLENYTKKDFKIGNYIHGDFWLSNILIDFKQNIKLIDMKGQINNKFTTAGDILYDYGKLFQSLIGYDMILYDDNINAEYINKILEYFYKKLNSININIIDLKTVTFSLIIGTFHSISDNIKKERVWNWLLKKLDEDIL